jgi:hypothetical protein
VTLTSSFETWEHHTACTRNGVRDLNFFFWQAVSSEVACQTSIKINFKDHKGILLKAVEANEGDDVLSIAHEHDIDLEGETSWLLVFSPQ